MCIFSKYILCVYIYVYIYKIKKYSTQTYIMSAIFFILDVISHLTELFKPFVYRRCKLLLSACHIALFKIIFVYKRCWLFSTFDKAIFIYFVCKK